MQTCVTRKGIHDNTNVRIRVIRIEQTIIVQLVRPSVLYIVHARLYYCFIRTQ